jgi:hypothetical protein
MANASPVRSCNLKRGSAAASVHSYVILNGVLKPVNKKETEGTGHSSLLEEVVGNREVGFD